MICVSDGSRAHYLQLVVHRDASAGDSREYQPVVLVVQFAHNLNSVLEMLVVVATLVKHFEFSLPADDEKKGARGRICRKPSVIMMPMVEGEIGAWMGLVIKPID